MGFRSYMYIYCKMYVLIFVDGFFGHVYPIICSFVICLLYICSVFIGWSHKYILNVLLNNA